MTDLLTSLFSTLAPLWEMSLTAVYVAAVVFLLRLLLKGRVPRQVLCLLWLVVFARLALPLPLQSPVSMVPSVLTEQMVQTARPGSEQDLPQPGAQTPAPNIPDDSDTQPQTQHPAQSQAPTARFPYEALLAGVWLAGVLTMTGYAVLSSVRFRSALCTAIRTEKGVWEHPAVGSPFIMGILRPKIYIPTRMDPESRRLILCHERSHLRRGDHIVKPICWLILAVHWFNPAAWAAFLLLSRDIEVACDELVLRQLGNGVKEDYSSALLGMAVGGRFPTLAPLTFGEGDASVRIKSVLRYRRPAFWLTAAGGAAVVVAVLCLLTDPVAAAVPDQDEDVQNVVQSGAAGSPAPFNAPQALTQEELDWFSNVFFAPNEGDVVNIRSMFLNSQFERPEDVSLYSVFWYGLTKAPDLTAEEQAIGGIRELGDGTVANQKVAKITSAELDAALMEYLGLTLIQTSQSGLDYFSYYPEYDAYYHTYSEPSNSGNFIVEDIYTVQSGIWNGDGTVSLRYVSLYNPIPRVVILREMGSVSYHFVSNLYVEE